MELREREERERGRERELRSVRRGVEECWGGGGFRFGFGGGVGVRRFDQRLSLANKSGSR